MSVYANAMGDSDMLIKELKDKAITAMCSAFEQLYGLFHGFESSAALDAELPRLSSFVERKATNQQADVLRVYLGAIDHVRDVNKTVGEETGSNLLEVRMRNEEIVGRPPSSFLILYSVDRGG